MVQTKLAAIPSVQSANTTPREKSEYVGGEVRNLTEDSTLSIALLFQSVPWTSAELIAFNVATSYLNNIRLKKSSNII